MCLLNIRGVTAEPPPPHLTRPGAGVLAIAATNGLSAALHDDRLTVWGNDEILSSARGERKVGLHTISSMALSNRGAIVLLPNGTVETYRFRYDMQVLEVVTSSRVASIASCVDGKYFFAVLAGTGELVVWNVDNGNSAWVPPEAQAEVLDSACGAGQMVALLGNRSIIAWALGEDPATVDKLADRGLKIVAGMEFVLATVQDDADAQPRKW
jgi:hypothetical protein